MRAKLTGAWTQRSSGSRIAADCSSPWLLLRFHPATRINGLCVLIQSPPRGITWLTWLVLSSSCGKMRDQAARAVARLEAALAALNGGSYGKRTGTRSRMSAAARARIAAAQRARWAKVRRNGGQKQNVVRMPKKKTMSAAARKKIAAAQKARWAKWRKAQKKG